MYFKFKRMKTKIAVAAIVGVVLIAGAAVAGTYIFSNLGSTSAAPSQNNLEVAAAAPTNTAKTAAAEKALIQAEKKLEQKICDLLPTTASRMPMTMLEVELHVPNNFDTQISGLGASIAFSNISTSLSRIYKNEKYFNCLYKTLYSATKECLLSMTANLGNGVSEKGLIKMTFTGNIGPYKPQNPLPVDNTVGDHPVSNDPYAGMDPMPMLMRTSCSVSFEKPCPAKANSVLCGQCDYDFANGSGTTKANLGQCFYCSSSQKCTWGSSGLCGSYSCVNSGGSNVKKPTTYFVNCSNCQKAGYKRSYSYSGTNKTTCRNYYNICRQCRYTDMKTNCN